jgi:hypothetical protein
MLSSELGALAAAPGVQHCWKKRFGEGGRGNQTAEAKGKGRRQRRRTGRLVWPEWEKEETFRKFKYIYKSGRWSMHVCQLQAYTSGLQMLPHDLHPLRQLLISLVNFPIRKIRNFNHATPIFISSSSLFQPRYSRFTQPHPAALRNCRQRLIQSAFVDSIRARRSNLQLGMTIRLKWK